MNRYIFITVVLFSFVPNFFSQEKKMVEKLIDHTVILPAVYGSKSNPVILNEDKNPIIINDKTFILTLPYMEEAFAWMDILPSSLKRWSNTDFELYKISGNTITENFFILHAAIYVHNKGAEITYRNNHIEIIADELIFSEYAFVYIMLEDEKYTIISFSESPHYNLLDGSHADTVGGIPTEVNRELAKDILYYYMKEKNILNIKASSIQLNSKAIKRMKKKLEQ